MEAGVEARVEARWRPEPPERGAAVGECPPGWAEEAPSPPCWDPSLPSSRRWWPICPCFEVAGAAPPRTAARARRPGGPRVPSRRAEPWPGRGGLGKGRRGASDPGSPLNKGRSGPALPGPRVSPAGGGPGHPVCTRPVSPTLQWGQVSGDKVQLGRGPHLEPQGRTRASFPAWRWQERLQSRRGQGTGDRGGAAVPCAWSHGATPGLSPAPPGDAQDPLGSGASDSVTATSSRGWGELAS